MRKLIPTLLLALTPFAAQASIVVDGNLFTTANEWSINPATLQAAPGSGVSYVVDDFFTAPGPYTTTPYGGQGYDAEALYTKVEGSTLYIGMITGHNPNNPTYAPGSFLFDFGGDKSFDYALIVSNNVKVASGKSMGSTVNGTGLAALTIGGLYAIDNSNLFVGPAKGSQYVGLNCSGFAGVTQTKVGQNAYDCDNAVAQGTGTAKVGGPVLNLGGDPVNNDKHWMYEIAIDTSAFGNDWGQSFSLQWSMYCGNDTIKIPTPGSLALLGLGLLGLGASRRRKSA